MTWNLRPDDWLARIIGYPAFRLVVPREPAEATGGGIPPEVAVALRAKPLFAFARVPATSPAQTGALEDAAFRVIDTSIILERDSRLAPAASPGIEVAFAVPADERETTALAGRAFSRDRFHLDPRFPRETADRIKEEWVRGYFRGSRGDALVVARAGGRIIGFLQVLTVEARVLVIDLIAVDKSVRGRGIAAAMTAFAAARVKNAETLRAGTQAANPAAMRFYERLGFRIVRADHVLHYHNR